MLKVIVRMIPVAILLAACQPVQAMPPATSLQLIQDTNSLSASLTAAMEFSNNGKTMVLPTSCAVKSIPIAWSGRVFSGWAYEGGDQKTVMLVRGRVSDDGSWIEAMKFSRKVLDQTAAGVEFEISVRYIPIADGGSGRSVGVFERTGDVGKHVERVNYDAPDTRYISTAWGAVDEIAPTLSIRLERAAFEVPVTPGVGCPCEW